MHTQPTDTGAQNKFLTCWYLKWRSWFARGCLVDVIFCQLLPKQLSKTLSWVIWKINFCKKILRIQTAQLPIKKSRSKQFSTIQRSTRPPAWIKLFSVKFAGQQRPRESWSWFASKDLNLLCLLKTPRETEVQCFSHAKKKRQQKPQPSGWTPI